MPPFVVVVVSLLGSVTAGVVPDASGVVGVVVGVSVPVCVFVSVVTVVSVDDTCSFSPATFEAFVVVEVVMLPSSMITGIVSVVEPVT